MSDDVERNTSDDPPPPWEGLSPSEITSVLVAAPFRIAGWAIGWVIHGFNDWWYGKPK